MSNSDNKWIMITNLTLATGKSRGRLCFVKLSDLAEETPPWGNSDFIKQVPHKRADLAFKQEMTSLLNR